jgi:hypothetical protein
VAGLFAFGGVTDALGLVELDELEFAGEIGPVGSLVFAGIGQGGLSTHSRREVRYQPPCLGVRTCPPCEPRYR